MSEAVVELPELDADTPAASRIYAPFAQLIKMLLPRSTSVAIHDQNCELTWCNDGYERPEIRELIEQHATATTSYSGRILETTSGQAVFLVHLASTNRRLGSLIVELGPTRTAWNETVVQSLLRPVLRCLENCIDLEHSVESSHDPDDSAMELLLGADEDNPEGPSPLHRLVHHSAEHLDCSVGALIVTDKNLVVAWDASGDDKLRMDQLLTRTQKNLLAWAQLNNRTMLVNHVASHLDTPSFKILSCPLHNRTGAVNGVLALFREPDQRDFDLKDVRILEFIAKRAVVILNSRHDELTGLPNKVIFQSRVQAALTAPNSDGHALLYIDLDRLQSINEAFGYQAGDEVIQRLAEAVQQRLRPVDMASRLGGDRLAVYLKNIDIEDASRVAEELVARMAGLSYLRDQQSLDATVSIGVVKTAPGAREFEHLLAAAEIACKEAKRQGGNCVVSLDQSSGKGVGPARKPGASALLEAALANNEFRLQAQPIVGMSISTGEVLGQEILLRLKDRRGTLLAPEKFFDVAHRYKLMSAIDRWVLKQTIQTLHDAGVAFPNAAHQITLNVSVQSIHSEGGDYVDFALSQIQDAGLSPELFRFDLRESVAIEHVDQAAPFMKRMRSAGCQVGLDDFGNRLSSFADLKDLPVQYLKIDGGLVRRIEEDAYAESVIKGIARAAEILGIFTIAEHVESESIATRLTELEINFGQGFHFGRPRPAEAVLGSLYPKSEAK